MSWREASGERQEASVQVASVQVANVQVASGKCASGSHNIRNWSHPSPREASCKGKFNIFSLHLGEAGRGLVGM